MAAELLKSFSEKLSTHSPDWLLFAQQLYKHATALRNPSYTVLVAGLCSVGKSSFTGALWGDATLLPAAVRDCTQTNTLLRSPSENENFPRLKLHYLEREKATALAARGLSYHRLRDLLTEYLGPLDLLETNFENFNSEQRLRFVSEKTQELFKRRNDLFVLHEYLSDDLEVINELLIFLDSSLYKGGGSSEAAFEMRREHLMGRRRPDGRPENLGPLLTLQRVELIAATKGWKSEPPNLLDTPWIPAFHEARRTELIREEAANADVLVLLSLPQLFEPEPWVLETLRERPGLARHTLVVFNQVDTVDTAALFAPDGFCRAFEKNLARMSKLGIPERNLYMSCARIPFLELSPPDETLAERLERLKKVVARIPKLLDGQPASSFKGRMQTACTPGDWGLESVRARIEEIGAADAQRERAAEALRALKGMPSTPSQFDQDLKGVEDTLESCASRAPF